ncbi:unnamed protein product [Didymodactylos carnosus]|uniref:FLYWCH-type domain-containing protein n=1 Tax=Didymodactylos carnosus TaxID=1234261 RepID=A0A816ASW5_9BILA|nr:unnamed protein product [Didymodactylos carnosus]CAF1601482.1 unnamed protein product [Didymodactylos carnosus]CAF4381733.1 unnamed protein product [Didymodactylos carnosus]CAF4478861.1 unnamed protein product [Didymodactylos carnosus]
MLHFTVTEKGNPVLNYKCYQNTKKRENKKSNQWRCRDRNRSSTISLCSQDLSIIKNEATHTCAQDTNKFISICWYSGYVQLAIKCGRAVKTNPTEK